MSKRAMSEDRVISTAPHNKRQAGRKHYPDSYYTYEKAEVINILFVE